MKIWLKAYKIGQKCVHAVERIYSTLITYVKFSIFMVDHKDFYTKGVPIMDVVDGSVKIGLHFRMHNSFCANTIGYATPCVMIAKNASIVIGDDVGMSQTVLIASEADIVIGNNVLFGGGVKIYSTDFHSLDYTKRRNFISDANCKKSAPVKIGNDVFIGAGSIVLKGVSIGNRSIVGAGSVVTKNIPSDEVWAGNPAKFLRRINNDVC